jgi:hypothetical protein
MVTHKHIRLRHDKHQLQSYPLQVISVYSGRQPEHIMKLASSKGMIGRMCSSNKPAVRRLSGTTLSLVPMSLWESFGQKEPQSSVTRYPAQRTHTVYQPYSVHHPDVFSAKTVSLPPQATGRSLWCKTHSRAQYTPQMDFSTSYSAVYGDRPWKLPA